MDSKPHRPRGPSLLDSDERDAGSPTSPAGTRSGSEIHRPAGDGRPRRRLWPLLLVAVTVIAAALLGYGGVFGGAPTPRTARAEADPGAVARQALQSPGSGAVDVVASAGAAVILPRKPLPAATVATVAPTSAARVGNDTRVLSRMFVPATDRKRAHPRRRVPFRAPARTDSDVALLTDLLRHVEAGGPAELVTPRHVAAVPVRPVASVGDRMQSCPPANTAEGVGCRRRLCAGEVGRAPACPAGSSGRLDKPE